MRPYLLGRDVTDHEVGAVQRVGEGVFVGCLVQLLNYLCRRKKKHPELWKSSLHKLHCITSITVTEQQRLECVQRDVSVKDVD